jgi:hypothetical protein
MEESERSSSRDVASPESSGKSSMTEILAVRLSGVIGAKLKPEEILFERDRGGGATRRESADGVLEL